MVVQPRFDTLLREIATELADDYRTQIKEKVCRWATATAVPRFYDSPPVRAYIQGKMLYRDGFYDATIMVSRSIAEMICYDRLDRLQHPFGTRQQVERKNFRQLIEWLHKNDAAITTNIFDRLNALYDLGNQYIHPKSGQNAKDDSLKALHLIGESVFDIYGVKTVAEMIGRTIRTPYTDFPDICSGGTFMLEAFLTPEDALRSSLHHQSSTGQLGAAPNGGLATRPGNSE